MNTAKYSVLTTVPYSSSTLWNSYEYLALAYKENINIK